MTVKRIAHSCCTVKEIGPRVKALLHVRTLWGLCMAISNLKLPNSPMSSLEIRIIQGVRIGTFIYHAGNIYGDLDTVLSARDSIVEKNQTSIFFHGAYK